MVALYVAPLEQHLLAANLALQFTEITFHANNANDFSRSYVSEQSRSAFQLAAVPLLPALKYQLC